MIDIGKEVLAEGKHIDRSHDVVEQTDRYTLYQIYTPEFFSALRSRIGRGRELPNIPELQDVFTNPNLTVFVVIIRGEIELGEDYRFLFVLYNRTQGVTRNRNMVNAITGNTEKNGRKWDTLTGVPNFFSHLVWKTPPRQERAEFSAAKIKAREEAKRAREQADEAARAQKRAEGLDKILDMIADGASVKKIMRAMRVYRYDDNPAIFLYDIVINDRIDILQELPIEKIQPHLNSYLSSPRTPRNQQLLTHLIKSLDMFKTLDRMGMLWKSRTTSLLHFLSTPSDISRYILDTLGVNAYPLVSAFLDSSPEEDAALEKMKILVDSGLELPKTPESLSLFLSLVKVFRRTYMAKVLHYVIENILDQGGDPNMTIQMPNASPHSCHLWYLGVIPPILNSRTSTLSHIKNVTIPFMRMLLDHGMDPNTQLFQGSRLLPLLIQRSRVCPASMLEFVRDLKQKYGYSLTKEGTSTMSWRQSDAFSGKTGTQFLKVRAYVLRQERIDSGTFLTHDDDLDERRKRAGASSLNESLQSARQRYGEAPAYFASKFDHTKTYKYTEWITKQLVNRFKDIDWTKSVAELRKEVLTPDSPAFLFLSEIDQVLSKFDDATTRNLIKEKDINRYKSINDVGDALDSPENQISGRKKKMLDKRGVRVIEDTDEHLVLRILTYEASCAYGAETKWCIASNAGPAHWDSYSEDNTIYFVFAKSYPFNDTYERRRYSKFAVLVDAEEDFKFFDADDKETNARTVEKYSGFDPLDLEYVESPYDHAREFSIIMKRFGDLDTYREPSLSEHLETFFGDGKVTEAERESILSEILDNLISGNSFSDGDFDIFSAISWAESLLDECPEFTVRNGGSFINTLLASLVRCVITGAFDDAYNPEDYYESFASIINTLRDRQPDAWYDEEFFSSVFADKRKNYDFRGVDPESFVAPLAKYAPQYLQDLVIYVIDEFQNLVQEYGEEKIFGFLEDVSALIPLENIKDEGGNTFADIAIQNNNQNLLNGLHDRGIETVGKDPDQLKLELESRSGRNL